MLAIIAVFCGLFGLAVGSFLNVAIYRVPAGLSLSKPGSHCPHCGHDIRWYDNVPVIGWLVLRGRCRDCGTRISIRYPLVELAGGIAFALVALAFAPGGPLAPFPAIAGTVTGVGLGTTIAAYLVLAALLWFAAASIALAAIDIETLRLPDRVVLPTGIVLLVLLAAASALTGDLWSLGRGLVGAAASFAFYVLIILIKPGGMGFGDAKLSLVLGFVTAWSGWPSLILGVFAAFLLGGVFGIVLLLARRAGRRSSVPFGPWMLAGAWVGIAAGPWAWSWYSNVLGLT